MNANLFVLVLRLGQLDPAAVALAFYVFAEVFQ